MNVTNNQHLTALKVDVINYVSIEVLENKGITEPTEQQIQTVERRLKRALKKGTLNLRAHIHSLRGGALCY